MKKIGKIIIINIIFAILSIVVLPITINLMDVLNIKYSTIYKFLSSITDSIIVKASDVDYGYSGNLYISNENYWSSTEDVAIYVYSRSGKGGFLEYSLNDSNFVEFEYGTSYSESTKYFELKTTINTIVVRDRDTKNIYLKGIIINNDKGCLTLQNAVVGHDKGNEIYKLRNNNIEDNEYSIDDGTTFNDVPNYRASGKINIEDLFNNKIIIRNKNTKEIIYKSPELGEIEESITYENGQTKVDFAVNGDAKDKTSYTHILNGEEFTGNSVTLKEDATLKLKAHTDKEFTDQTIEKDINVKVIKTEKPTIKIDEEHNLILTQGAIENDELANIYYSIDNETEKTYTGKVKLEVGTHKIKAYQVTKKYEIKSDIAEAVVTVKDNKEPEVKPNEDKDPSNNNNNNKDLSNDEQNNNTNSNEENKNTETEKQKSSENKNIPKTGDMIMIYVVVLFVIITLNIVINRKRKNK